MQKNNSNARNKKSNKKNKNISLILILIAFIVVCHIPLLAKPFQLIESESAVLNRKGAFETKINYAYETGHIPVNLLVYRIKYGLFSRFEIGLNANAAYFHNQKDFRVTEAGITLKALLWKFRPSGMNLCGYFHYRHANWKPLWEPVITEVSRNESETRWMVSPHADGGMDFTGGFLLRHPLKKVHKQLSYMAGVSYSRLEGRDYGDFYDNQKNRFSANLSPEFHFYKGLIMIALENIFVYWHNRGSYYSVVPQIRFEPIEYWVIEIGTVVPVAGAGNYRIIAGFNHEFF
ncbi:MAG: hypothetical protein GY754_02320 [bacterium]|nr:hypothetical protein [bacterium]